MMGVRQWSTHKEPYLVGCKFEQVEPNECIMTADKEGSGLLQQVSLEEWTVTKAPQWLKKGLMEHIVELIMVDDQVRKAFFM